MKVALRVERSRKPSFSALSQTLVPVLELCKTEGEQLDRLGWGWFSMVTRCFDLFYLSSSPPLPTSPLLFSLPLLSLIYIYFPPSIPQPPFPPRPEHCSLLAVGIHSTAWFPIGDTDLKAGGLLPLLVGCGCLVQMLQRRLGKRFPRMRNYLKGESSGLWELHKLDCLPPETARTVCFKRLCHFPKEHSNFCCNYSIHVH